MDLQQHHSYGGQEMGVKIAEMAGGLLQLAAQLIILWAILEVACRLFFKWYERGRRR